MGWAGAAPQTGMGVQVWRERGVPGTGNRMSKVPQAEERHC